jgi:hypothetical protein
MIDRSGNFFPEGKEIQNEKITLTETLPLKYEAKLRPQRENSVFKQLGASWALGSPIQMPNTDVSGQQKSQLSNQWQSRGKPYKNRR